MIVYAIPGLGCTEKLFENTAFKNAELKVLNWPTPEKNETLQSFAKKFVNQIDRTKPFCLLGVSFGGMLCIEISKMILPQKTFLISTCKSRNELPWFIKLLKPLPIHNLVSERYHRKLAYHGRWFVGFGSAYIPEFLGMVNHMQKNYFTNCINMIARWDNTVLPTNTFHIHGTNDKLLSHKHVIANCLIPEGSHAMIVFRAEEINTVIDNELIR